MNLDQQVSENRAWINSVIVASKLASELVESLQITNSNQTINIQEGQNDATFAKVPVIRGSLGSYNPVTNTPTLADGTGIVGDNYSISVEGIINLGSGNITFLIDDFVSYNGSKWIKTTKSQISDIQGLQAKLDALSLALTPQGNWNASTNTPDIDAVAETSDYWIVSVAGTTSLGGINDWGLNDLAIKTASGWAKIDNSESVVSVFGRLGAIIALEADYEAFYTKISTTTALANANLKASVNGNPFILKKSPGNTLTSLEANDMILIGFWDTTEFISLAIYLGGDKDTKTNYNILESTTGL
jgi:hypothetical protein